MIDAAALRVVVSADTSKAQSELKSFSGGMKNMAGQMGAVGGILSATIAAPLIGIGVSAIKTAASFEKSMNVLQYVTDGTSATMQAMSDQALQLGADTVFSANEAAEGMVELAKAGMDTEDVMGAIPGVMDLAAAGQISVAEAAGLTAATLATFSLEASQSAEVADILAAAANASSADIRDLAFGVQNAGSVFAASGQSVDTLATMMAILANNGLNASDAATSVKTMTMRLTAPTEKAANVMEDLGIAVFDADGAMRDYRDIIADMEVATKSLSDEQKAAAFNTVFGADAIRSALIFAKEGVDVYDEMNAKVLEQGASADMAAAQNSGLAGAMDAISGSIDTLFTKLALPFLDEIAEWTGKITEVVNKMGELPDPVVKASLAFLGFAAATGLTLLGLSGAVATIGALTTPIGLLALALVGAGLAAAVLWTMWETNFDDIQGKTDEALGVINPLLDTMKTNLLEAATNLGALLALNPQWQSFITNAKNAATAATSFGQNLADAVSKTELPSFETLKLDIETRIEPIIAGIQLDWSTLTWSTNIIVQQVGAELSKIKWDGLVVDFTGMLTTIGTRIQQAAETQFGADNIVSRTIARVGDTLKTIQTEFADLDLSDPIDAVKSVFTAAYSLVTLFTGVKTDVMTTAVKTLESVITTILGFGSTLVDSIDAQTLADAATGIVTGLTDAITTVVDADTLGGIGAAAGDFVSSIVTKFGELLGADQFGTDIGTAIGGATVAIAQGATAFATSFADELAATDWAQFRGQMSTFITGLVTSFFSQIGPALWEASIFNPAVREEAMKRENWWQDMPWMRGITQPEGHEGLTGFDILEFINFGEIGTEMANSIMTGMTTPPDWVTSLTNWKPATPGWVTSLLALLGGGGAAGGSIFMPTLPNTRVQRDEADAGDGLAEMLEIAGANIVAFSSTVATFVWPAVIAAFAWPSAIAAFAWPASLAFSWSDWMEYLDWGRFVSWLQGPSGGGGGSSAGTGFGGGGSNNTGGGIGFDANASGTPYWRGGATWVGEEGPELVNLPRGAAIYSNEESMAMAGVHITVNVASINSALDIEVLAAQLAKRFQQKMRS